MEIAHLLEGIIMSGFIGLAMGNFATNPIFRLPRREPLFLKDPYCDHCQAQLKPIDLFPVLSWLMTRGKCRYCGVSFPATYACIEAVIGLLFIVCYLKAGLSEQFILVSFGMTALVMVAMMLYLDNFFSGKTVIASIFLGALSRALQDGTIYGAGGGLFAGAMIGAVAWRFSGKPLTREIADFPPYLGLLATAGTWLPLPQVFIAALAAGVALLFSKHRPWMVEWTIIAFTITAVIHGLR